jgi:hypothetical protein
VSPSLSSDDHADLPVGDAELRSQVRLASAIGPALPDEHDLLVREFPV